MSLWKRRTNSQLWTGKQEMAGGAGICYIHLVRTPRSPTRNCREDSWGGCKWKAPCPVPQMRLHVFWKRLEKERRGAVPPQLLCILHGSAAPLFSSSAVMASGPQLLCHMQEYHRPAASSSCLRSLLLPTSSAIPSRPALLPTSFSPISSPPPLLPSLSCPPCLLPPLSSSHPFPGSPSSLLGTLAGLLLTEESLDLRHPLCLALSGRRKGVMRVPGLQKGSSPWRGEWGRLGEEKQSCGCSHGSQNELCSFLSLLPCGTGAGPSLQ